MATRADKILRKMRRKKSNHPARDVWTVYKEYGFIEERGRGKGSHRLVRHTEHKHLFATLPNDGTAAIYVVKQLLKNISKLDRLTEGKHEAGYH